MTRRIGRVFLRLSAGVLVVLAALTGLLIWRAAEEPISVGFLLPMLEPRFASLPSGLRLEVADIVIAWDRHDHTIGLRAEDVVIRSQAGPALLHFPAVDVGVSPRALVHGVVALTAIEIKNPSLVVSRHRDGALTIAGADFGREHQGEGLDATAMARGIAEDMLGPEDPSRPLSYLREVGITGGSIIVNDAVLEADWRLPLVDFSFSRGSGGLVGQGRLHLAVGDAVARLDAAVSYADLKAADRTAADRAAAEPHRTINLSAAFTDLRPSSLADLLSGIDPALAELAALDLAFRGAVTVKLDPFAAVVRPLVTFRINGSAGVLSHHRFPEPLLVHGLQAEGRLDTEQKRVDLDRAIVMFGSADAPGPTLSLSGVVQEHKDHRTLAGAVTLERLAMAESNRYWPEGVAKGARKWVTRNIKDGMLDAAAAEFQIRVPHDPVQKVHVERADGTLSYHGLDVQYLREVPTVSGLTGTGVFDRSALYLKATDGTSENLRVPDVKVAITGLDRRDEVAVIDLGLEGAIPDALTLLNHPRFKLASKIGLKPLATGGSFAGRLKVTVPLITGVRLDDVGLHFVGQLEDASIQDIRHLPPGIRGSNGRLDLEVDTSQAHLAGSIEINGVPVQLDWTDAFSAEAPFATKASITANNVDNAARRALGVDLASFVDGPVSVAIEATLARGGSGTVNASADLTTAALALPFLSWRKEAGATGEVEAVLAIEGNRLSRLTRVRIDAGSLSAEGEGALDASEDQPDDPPDDPLGATGGWLDLDRLAFAGSVLKAVSVDWTADDIAVDIGGGTLDAAPFLARAEREGGLDGLGSRGRFSLTATNLGRLIFAEGRYLENVGVRLDRSRAGWEQIQINALVPAHLASSYGEVAAGPQSLSFRYGPLEGGSYPLLIRISDTGGLLRAVDAVDGIKGGYCEIVGRSEGAVPGSPMRATLSCQRITDTEASPMGKILNALSISGIRQALAGEGITFDQAEGDIVWHDGTVTIVSGEAYNSALGVTLEGRLGFDPHDIEAEGTVIPVYTINRLIGRIPLIGGLLNEGEGFFAGHFRVRGTLADPEITARPIKSITPNILIRFKNLFTKSPDRSSPADSGPLTGTR